MYSAWQASRKKLQVSTRMADECSHVHVLRGSVGERGTFQKVDGARNAMKRLLLEEMGLDRKEVAKSGYVEFVLGWIRVREGFKREIELVERWDDDERMWILLLQQVHDLVNGREEETEFVRENMCLAVRHSWMCWATCMPQTERVNRSKPWRNSLRSTLCMPPTEAWYLELSMENSIVTCATDGFMALSNNVSMGSSAIGRKLRENCEEVYSKTLPLTCTLKRVGNGRRCVAPLRVVP